METAIDGFQGPPGHLDDADRVLATAKHYAGDGDTQYGTAAAATTRSTRGSSITNHEIRDFWRSSPTFPPSRGTTWAR